MSVDNWLSLITGIVVLVIAVVLIRFRVGIANFISGTYGSVNSAVPERAAVAAKPSTILVVGVVAILIGLGSIAMGLFRHSW